MSQMLYNHNIEVYWYSKYFTSSWNMDMFNRMGCDQYYDWYEKVLLSKRWY